MTVRTGGMDPSNACRVCQPDASTSDWSGLQGTPCGDASVCWNETCQAGCFIDGAIVAPDAPDPTNPCLTCQPTLSVSGWTAWTGLATGGGCDGGACVQGSCMAVCAIEGATYQMGDPDPLNACRACQPAIDPGGWSTLTDVSCAGGVCKAGTCEPGCTIGGNPFAQGSLDPSNPCLGCDPSLNLTSFSPLPGGTPCNDGGVCVAGSCQQACSLAGVFFPLGSKDPEDSCLSCQSGPNGFEWGVFPGLATGPCDGGQVCDHGLCRPGCGIDGQYWAPRAYEPGPAEAPTFCCNPMRDPATWTPGFQAGNTFSALVRGYPANQIVAADFDRDGLTDIATLNPGPGVGGSIGVYLGLGGGEFGTPIFFATGSNPGSLSVGDLNGDGFPDLVLRDDQGIGVFLNKGLSGTSAGFLPEAVTSVNGGFFDSSSASVALGDLDGNGTLEILTAERPSQISVFLNDGDGGLGAAILSTLPKIRTDDNSLSPVLGDLDRDGLPDVALSTRVGLAIALNLGGGAIGDANYLMSFCSAQNDPWVGSLGAGEPASLAVGCFARSALILFPDPVAQPLVGTTYAVPPPFAMVGGDVNGDGWMDLVSLASDSVSGTSMSLLLASPDGGFLRSSATALDSSTQIYGFAIGQLHGGSSQGLDIVLHGGQTFTVWLNGCP